MSELPWRITIGSTGGPEVLRREHFEPAAPGPDEVRVAIRAIGLNFIDTYHRAGLYPLPLPSGLGVECAGVVESVGAGVSNWKTGDRVGCLPEKPGTYATHITMTASQLIPLPDFITDDVAAAVLLKGFTCWMLADRCGRVQPGQIVLVHSAAGGVGSMLVPWLKSRGATVIAHAGTEAKAETARKRGADHALSVPFEDLATVVRELTNGHGADVVFDGVGAASWHASLALTARRGLLISYGNASGPVPPLVPLDLLNAGSIFLTRPRFGHYADSAETRAEAAARLFGLIRDGTLQIDIGRRYALSEVAEAHRALEARQTMGSTILFP